VSRETGLLTREGPVSGFFLCSEGHPAVMKLFRVSLVLYVYWVCCICNAGITGNAQVPPAAEEQPLPPPEAATTTAAAPAATETAATVEAAATPIPAAGTTTIAGAASTTVEAAVPVAAAQAADDEASIETVKENGQSTGLSAEEINREVDKISNEATDQIDSYSMYRDLMNLRHKITVQEVPEDSENLRMVKSAIKVVIETAFHSFINGFLPHVDRMRREAGEDKRSYLDGVVYVAGALVGKTKCSSMIACRAGKFIQDQIPGAQLAVMMAESMVPKSMLSWYQTFKTSVIDRTDNCDAEYECSLSEQIEDKS